MFVYQHISCFFFFNDTATTEIYTLSLHDALPICQYSSYKGSLWDQGILPLDTLNLLEKARGGYVEVDRSSRLDWDALRAKIGQHGMRNSNCLAIAPTATISNIVGADASIEPSFGNLSGKSNLSGHFT